MTHFRGGGSRTPYSHHVEFVRDDESVRRRGRRRTSSVRTPNFRNSGGGRSIDGNRYLQTRISASDVLLPTFFENSKSRRGVMDLRSFTPRETRVQRRTVDAYIDLSFSLSRQHKPQFLTSRISLPNFALVRICNIPGLLRLLRQRASLLRDFNISRQGKGEYCSNSGRER